MNAPIDPEALRPHYRRFLAAGRILLTGHSHQAWPDVAREGVLQAFDDAAAHADDKWNRALEAGEEVAKAAADELGVGAEEIALGASTHELGARFLSALDLKRRPHLLSTDGEFHSLDRQLRRLAEAGLEVERLPARPVATLAERLAAQVRDDTAAVLVSTVLFETAEVVPHLEAAVRAAEARGAFVLLDGYHAFMAMPCRLGALAAGPVFYTAGGYKYAQWGEGACFLRVPPQARDLRPVYTGWFSDFANLAEAREGRPIGYGQSLRDRFAGSTYDPTSHYRARAVIGFFREQGLTIDRLRDISSRQTERILRGLEAFDVRTPSVTEARGGFVAVKVEKAQEIVATLRGEGIFTDARGSLLRLGPAPYVTDIEIDRALGMIRETKGLASH